MVVVVVRSSLPASAVLCCANAVRLPQRSEPLLLAHPSRGVMPMLVSTLSPRFTAVTLLPLPASSAAAQAGGGQCGAVQDMWFSCTQQRKWGGQGGAVAAVASGARQGMARAPRWQVIRSSWLRATPSMPAAACTRYL